MDADGRESMVDHLRKGGCDTLDIMEELEIYRDERFRTALSMPRWKILMPE